MLVIGGAYDGGRDLLRLVTMFDRGEHGSMRSSHVPRWTLWTTPFLFCILYRMLIYHAVKDSAADTNWSGDLG